jgi:hypothetical protein
MMAAGGAIVRVDDAHATAPALPPRCADVVVGKADGGSGEPSGTTPVAASGDPGGGSPAGALTGAGTTSTTPTTPTTTAASTRARTAAASAKLHGGRLVLRVALPRRATVVVRCTGHGCSAHRRAWTLKPGTHHLTVTTKAARPDVTVTVTIAGKTARAWRLRAGRVRVVASPRG